MRALFSAREAACLGLAAAAGAVFGWRALALGLALAALLLASRRLAERAGDVVRFALVPVETLAVLTALIWAGPIAGGGAIPTPMLFFSPAALALFCLLTAQSIGARPALTLWAGVCAMTGWTALRQLAMADPDTITHAMVNPDDYETLMAYLQAITRPHYQDDGLWKLQMAALAGFTVTLALAAWRARRLARRAADAQAARDGLAAHFSGAVLETLLSEESRLGGEGLAAVLDCDLTGYTAAVDGLAPERTAALLRAWHGLVEDQAFAHGGAVLKFTGDGVSAVFGLGGEVDAAGKAAACARAVVSAWPAAAEPLDLTRTPGVAAGLDFGPVRWGVVGAGRAASLVVLGEPVAGAARLQAQTRGAGAPILVGPAAAAELGAAAIAPPHGAGAWRLA
jgi:adenylate cyclase